MNLITRTNQLLPKATRNQAPIRQPKNSLIVGRQRKLFITQRTKTFLQVHQMSPKMMFLIKKAIRANHKKEAVTIIEKNKSKATIKRENTGTWKGMSNFGTYRVSIGKQKWFVKLERGNLNHLETLLVRFGAVRTMINDWKGKINGFRVRLIEPELIYYDKKSREIFLATKFFEKHEVKLMSDIFSQAGRPNQYSTEPMLPRTKKREALIDKLTPVVYRIQGEIEERTLTREQRLPNLFYEEKTNTIWIFDMGAVNQNVNRRN